MKLLYLIAFGLTTVIFFDPKRDFEKDAVFTCNDDVFLNRKPGGGVIKIKSDMNEDSLSWSVSLTGEPVFLGKITFPGLYRVAIDADTTHLLAFSCKDVSSGRKSKITYCYDASADVDSVRKSMLAVFDTLNRCVNKITQDTINFYLKELAELMRAELDSGKYNSFALSITLDNPTALLLYDPDGSIVESDAVNGVNKSIAKIFELFTRNETDTLLKSSTDEMLAFTNFFKPRPPCNTDGNKLTVYQAIPVLHVSDELLSHYSKVGVQSQSLIWFGYREKYFNQLLLAGRIIGNKKPSQ